MYDFESSGLLQREDVRIILSYVPFKSDEEVLLSPRSRATSSMEGLYDNSSKSFDLRMSNQDDIARLLDIVSFDKAYINFTEYCSINEQKTSEMFTSLMRVLHETLPCSRNFFKMRRKFRNQYTTVEESKGEA